MARRRVFRVSIHCAVCNDAAKSLKSGVSLRLRPIQAERSVEVQFREQTIGALQPQLASQVLALISQGVQFIALAEEVSRQDDGGQRIRLKIEYLLEKGQIPVQVVNQDISPNPGKWRTFYSKIVGLQFPNPNRDDTSRRESLRGLYEEERLILQREPDNPKDMWAVRVLSSFGEQVGYLPAEVVYGERGIGWNVATHMDEGYKYFARVANIHRENDGAVRGVAIAITYWEGPVQSQPLEPVLEPMTPRPADANADQENKMGTTKGSGSGCMAIILCFGAAMATVVTVASQLN